MIPTNAVEAVPLRVNDDGLMIYVGDTRVPLETVIRAHKAKNTPEQIVARYDALNLADVYVVIGYYLHHTEEVEAYLKIAEEDSLKVRQANQERFDASSLREELLARRKQRD
jgi:hypothetical protein